MLNVFCTEHSNLEIISIYLLLSYLNFIIFLAASVVLRAVTSVRITVILTEDNNNLRW